MSLELSRWAFLNTETGDWIEVKEGTVHGPLSCPAEKVRDEYQRFYDFVGDNDPALVDAWHFTENVRHQEAQRAATPPSDDPGDHFAYICEHMIPAYECKVVGCTGGKA